MNFNVQMLVPANIKLKTSLWEKYCPVRASTPTGRLKFKGNEKP